MRRREFIAALGSAAAWPLVARAQEQKRLRTIGLLGSTTRAAWEPWIDAFVHRLHELGWIEGRNIAIEYGWAEGRSERGAEIADAFVRNKVDLIVATGGSVPALKVAVTTVPVVFATWADPVGSGYIASLARPGGNATGLSIQALDTAAKRLEILREVVPGLRRLAILGRLDSPSNAAEVHQISAAAPTLGLEIAISNATRTEDIGSAIEALKGGVDALYVIDDPVLVANRVRINTLALGAQLPTIYGNRESVQAGGLMSYGANFSNLWRRAAELVDKILRGTKPGDIPVEQPTKFDLFINLVTAKALGLKIPPNVLARADEVIE
jgi:putative ABC transport system substrate-binding protein